MVRPNLLRGMLIVSLCAVVFLPLYAFFFLYPSFDRLLTDKTEGEAVRFASHMASMFFSDRKVLTKDSITPEITQGLEDIAKEMQLVKVKVFNPSGEILYSTDAKDIGETNRNSYFLDILARGRVYTQVVKKAGQTLEGQMMSRDVVETYVPLMNGGRFLGAFELYYDITGSREQLGSLISRSMAIVLTVTLGLMLVLIASALNVNRSIRERERAEDELRRHRDHLEQLVESRTREILQASRQLEQEMDEKRHLITTLQDTEAKYRSLVESTEDSIYLVDKGHRYLFMNKRHMKRMGLFPDQVHGRPYSEFHTSEDTEKFIGNVSTVFATGESLQSEHKSKRDGRYFLQTLSPVTDPDGKVVAVTIVSKDITDRRTMEDNLRSLSLTDELTGLCNRRGFFTFAEQYIKISNRMKNRVSILYADLDALKEINDRLGHQMGDRAIAEAAGMLRETFRESDVVARIGGDEFVVMPVVLNNVPIEVITERLIANIAKINAAEGRPYKLSISFGIAFYDPATPCSIEELLNRGDSAMYEHKKKKKSFRQ